MHLRNNFAMGIDNPTAIAESLSHYTYLTGDPESLNRLYALYQKVTAKDIMTVAKKFINANSLTVATIGPGETGGVK
jgi:zinc protease